MSYSYLALINSKGRIHNDQPDQAEILNNKGMNVCFSSSYIKLYVSTGTPTIHLSNGGIIIGNLFTNEGNAVLYRLNIPNFTQQSEYLTYILKNYWGDYLMFCPKSENEKDLTILRDPSGGVRCLYNLTEGDGFITSDISIAIQLKLYKKKINWDFLPHCLAYPYLKTQRTGLCDIKELLPGCSLTIHEVEITTRTEWSPWDFIYENQRYIDSQLAAKELRRAVESTVIAFANIDGSILLELSGGVDSSIVAASLKETKARVNCCNLVTPVPGADERSYAVQMADYLNVKLHVETLSFDDIFFSFPPPPSAVTPRMIALQQIIDSAMQRAGELYNVTSFFSGSGGDTIFCFLKNSSPAVDAFKEMGLKAGISAIRDLSDLHECTIWKAARLTLRKLMKEPKQPCEANHEFIAPDKIISTPEPHPWFNSPANLLPGDRDRVFELIGTQIFRDSSPRGGKLRRLPLLSQPVIETCLKIPSWMWISGGKNRAVARTAFSDRLPLDILNRRSKGNFLTFSGGAYQRNKNLMREFLHTGQLKEHGLLDIESLECYFVTEHPPRDHSFMRIFELCMIENWVAHQL